jgi:hypothetical protein
MLEELGHVLVYGETCSGKTTIATKICNYINPTKIFVYTGVLKCYKRVFEESEVYDNFENIKEIKKYIMDNHEHNNYIILFDDFNDKINTQTNTDYIELFTKYRHYNTRIINLAHSVKAIGRTIRTNCRYIYIFSTISNNETIKDLAVQYFESNNRELEKILKQARSDNVYNVIYIDRRNGSYEIMNANDIVIREIDIAVNMPNKSSIMNRPEESNYMGVPVVQEAVPVVQANNNAQLNFQKKAEKDFIDNSNNKITYNSTITSNQLIQTKRDQHEVKILNLHLEHKYSVEEKREKLKNNLINPNRSEIEKMNIIKDLKYFAKIPVKIDEDNYLEYGMLFLKKNFDINIELYENKKNNIDLALDIYRSVNANPLDMVTSLVRKYTT